MTKSQKKDVEETEVVETVAEEVEETVVAAPAPAAPVGRKPLGTKEPIIFNWKIVGHSQGVAVTLFKSTEREDSDAQLERLIRDGYYSHLEIMDANAKVIQPAPPKEVRRPAKTRDDAAKSPSRTGSKKSAKSSDAKRTTSSRRSSSGKASGKDRSKSRKAKDSKSSSRKLAKKK